MTALLWSSLAEAADIPPGEPRFAAIVAQVLHLAPTPIRNDPACPGADDGRKRTALADALAGAMAREAAGGTPVRFSLNCADTPSPRTKECRLLLAGTDPDAESSAGVSFDLRVPEDRIVPASLRCTMNP